MSQLQYKESNKWFRVIPIILILSVLPLITRLQPLQNVFADQFWQNAEADFWKKDVFLCWKAGSLCVLAVIMLCLMLRDWMKNRSFPRQPVWPLCFPLLFVLLSGFSTLFSSYPAASLKGTWDQMEPIWILLSYAVVFVFSCRMPGSADELRLILRVSQIGIAVMAALGVLQFFGADPLRWDWVKCLIAPREAENLVFNFPPGRVYLTLFNPNYVGSYVAMVFPLIIALAASSPGWKKKLPAFVLGPALLLCLLGSGAKNGFIALAVVLLFLVLFYRQRLFRSGKAAVAIAACTALLLAGLEMGTGIFSSVLKDMTGKTESKTGLEEILTLDECIRVTYQGEPLSISYKIDAEGYFSMAFTDNAGREINYEVNDEDGLYELKDSRFADLLLQPCMIGEEIGFSLEADGYIWYFINHPEEGGYYFSNQQDKLVKLHKVPSAVFTHLGSAFSGRGYIWSRAIPLLKDYFLFGSGPDTFAAVFPQEDYVGMLNQGYGSQLITRAHNLYLQTAVQLGVPALLAFLIFYGVYLVTGIKCYWNHRPETFLDHVGAGLTAGTLGYMISGLINDSLVVTTPVFCCLLGLGTAVNTMVKKQRAVSPPAR